MTTTVETSIIVCPTCQGEGLKDGVNCSNCTGSGMLRKTVSTTIEHVPHFPQTVEEIP